MFPNTKEFADVLTKISIQPKNGTDYEKVSVFKEDLAFDETGRKIIDEPVDLWYPKDSIISFNSLVRKVREALGKVDHFNSEDVAKIVLLLYATTKSREVDATKKLNEIFDSVVSADVTQNFVGPFPPPKGFSFKLGDFNVGVLDSTKLSNRCRKAKSDFFDRHKKRLLGNISIERDYFPTNVLEWNQHISAEDYYYNTNHTQRVIYKYYSVMAKNLNNDFWDTMLEQQHLYIAYDDIHFSPDIIKLIPYQMFVTIFLNIGKDNIGFVAPDGLNKLIFDFGGINKTLPKVKSELENKYGFTHFENTEIHQLLKTFVLYVSKAKRHKLEKRNDESFLHFIIALDLLLGDKNASSHSVAKRASILTHRQMGVEYVHQKKNSKNYMIFAVDMSMPVKA